MCEMKIKTSELQGAALDWAVAKCEGIEFTYEDHPHHEMFDMHYSTDWAQGGPIIQREKIATAYQTEDDGWEVPNWAAWMALAEDRQMTMGETPLVAAMRCYVASKLGPEVDVPEEVK